MNDLEKVHEKLDNIINFLVASLKYEKSLGTEIRNLAFDTSKRYENVKDLDSKLKDIIIRLDKLEKTLNIRYEDLTVDDILKIKKEKSLTWRQMDDLYNKKHGTLRARVYRYNRKLLDDMEV